MIMVRLMGGLGNQMFQYALARTLALKRRTSLCIDTSLCVASETLDISGLSLRPFGLQVFDIHGEIVDQIRGKKFIRIRKEHRFKRATLLPLIWMLPAVSHTWRVNIYERKHVGFDRTLLHLPDHVCLQGYFPSFKYFQDFEEVLRREFVFRSEPDSVNQRFIEDIRGCHAVSIHIRRGDYLSNARSRQKFGICGLTYYRRAMQKIAERVSHPRFYVFTNDPEFVQENLRNAFTTVCVTHNTGQKSYEDMRLMSCCRHHIIANSSFSWWGAWLNSNTDKIVIGPSPVFDQQIMPDDDFLPETWIRIPKDQP